MADSGAKKVLKTLVIRDGKVVEERQIKAGQNVTVGPSDKSTFVLKDDKLPSDAFVLFEAGADGYVLRFTKKMKGKLALSEFKGSLRKYRKTAEPDGEIYTVGLSETDKGSVEIGDGAIWFKFEEPPAPPPAQAVKALDEIDFRPVLFEEDDPVFLGWLAIWSALATVLIVFVWNTVPREVELEELPDRFTKMVVEEEPEEVEIDDTLEDPDAESATRKKEEKAKKPPKDETAVEKAERRDQAKKDVIAKSALLQIVMMGTTGESDGGVVEKMWGDGNEGIGDIDGVLGEVDGAVVDGGPSLRTGEGGSGEASGIGDLGGVEGGSASVGGGPKVVAKPTIALGEGSMDDDIGDSSGASGVVKKNYGQLKYCYEKHLRTEASLEGRVEIGWSVYGGAVEGVYVISNSTGSSGLADCIVKRIERWTFSDEIEGDMSWPFVFRQE